MSVLAQSLKQHNAAVHTRVEAGLNLLDPTLDGVRLRAVVVRLIGFWLGSEPAIDRWAECEPAVAAQLAWSRRRRSDGLRADLVTLGVDPADVPTAPPVFGEPDVAEVLGWLYVVEGSTLGGAVIGRRNRAVLDGSSTTFTPYAEGPGPMWRAYLAAAQAWAGEDERRRARVVAASVRTFGLLEAWVAPIFTKAAA